MIPFIDRVHHVIAPTSHTNNSPLHKASEKLMRILITGVTGQVGAALLEALSPSATVLGADRSVLDLSQPEKIPAALERFAPHMIVNPAAYTAVDRAEDEKELAFRVNAEAPGVIARWAAPRGVPVIHFSTDYVFDGTGRRPWHEDDPTGPLSVYGASKLAGELEVQAAAGPHLIIRTSWVYGSTGSNFLRTIVRLAQERTELRIVADQFGAPTPARLIAKAVSAIIADDGPSLARRFSAAGGLVNVSATGETTWCGFATRIIQGMKSRSVTLKVQNIEPIPSNDFPAKAKRPLNSRLDLTRLTKVFGIHPPSWDEALNAELDVLARAWVNAGPA
jgi:dTDP-4-dehydrorhamnose reductase